MKKRYLEAAKITKPVGLRGEMRAQLLCDDPQILIDFDLYLGRELEPVKAVSAVMLKNDMCRIRLEGTDTVEKAEKLTGKILYLDREDVQLPENTWFIADLIGLPVYDADSGVLYGSIDEILQNGPTDVYSIKTPDKRQLLFPAIPEVLLKVDIEDRIVIRPLKGLFDTENEDGAEEYED